ncbi:MAG: ArsA family ATPase [Desulfobacterales bacterium]|nr:ArsA family ATPase [Desulfobacterales bacterium]
MNPNELNWLNGLFAQRLIFVMGKGGVGKTTVSVLLGMEASRRKKKTLLVELGDSDAIGKIFASGSLPEEPSLLSECLWGARINPKAELEAYTRAHINSNLVANRIIESRLFDYLFAATPGLKEVMSLGRIWRWEQAVDKASLPLFDLIIVDSPATGHGLSLLRLPGHLVQMIRVGPLVSQINELQNLLQNPQKTSLALVTLPQELPVNETIELYDTAESLLKISVRIVFINQVWPALYTSDDIKSVNHLSDSLRSDSSNPSWTALLDAARRHIDKRAHQDKYIAQIASAIPSKIVGVPFSFTNDLILDDINRMTFEVIPSSSSP